MKEKPDLVIVAGDVNSTIACSLAAVKLGIKVAHVEVGLRSFDRSMPEEINRIITDSISDYLFVTEKSGIENLKREGTPEVKIYFVGNVMIDSLIHYLHKAENSEILSSNCLEPKTYCLVTLHRPSNVDNQERLNEIIELINKIALKTKVVFPIHPRTKKIIENNTIPSVLFRSKQVLDFSIILSDPFGYLDFLALMKNAALVLTDSGGIQEEMTFLGIPCITLRLTTERPITSEIGTNYMAGENLDVAYSIFEEIIEGRSKKGSIPELWDGNASERIVKILMEQLNSISS